MKNLTLEKIASACGGSLHNGGQAGDICVESITSDSRQAGKGCLFVPIVGARADGHNFISQVMEKGALCTLSERDLPEVDFPWIKVASSLEAVKDIARFYLKGLGIPVVAITGSVGKTSTKEMVASVLGQKYRVLKTLGNFNNELGLPLTIFRLREEHELAVLEMGISDFGEMDRLSSIAPPDTGLITNIGWCHLENLGDLDGVRKAKTEMFSHLKAGGRVVLNGDDPKLREIGEVGGQKPVFFGLAKENDVWADEIRPLGLEGTACRIHIRDKEGREKAFSLRIPVAGSHMVSNALAGTALGSLYGLDIEEIKKGIEEMETISGRLHIIKTEEVTVIDDCYNANPMSMKASLGVLAQAEGRKVAILGDMGELGKDEKSLHREVGEFAAGQDIQLLVCAGDLSVEMAAAAQEACKKTGRNDLEVLHMENLEKLLKELPQIVKKGDTILVKASHFMAFDKIVEKLEA